MNKVQPSRRNIVSAVMVAVLFGVGWTFSVFGGEPGATAPAGKQGAAAKAPKPVTTVQGPVGDLLRKWYAQQTAAGNNGDYYDNRDRGHSDLNMALYPQLSRVPYTEEDRKFRRDWAIQGVALPGVVFGNSSTAGGVAQGGSNARILYTYPQGLWLLYAQYRRNNIYIYPSHRDYQPGHNGSPGFGDLYPTNSPYLIISQGSSGSDQPFMQAIALTLAAFKPRIKLRLIDSGLLMPTIQMIFRITNEQLVGSKEYLTGKAHPPMFEGSWVSPLKMVHMAHGIAIDTIPPMIQFSVVEEDEAVLGRDFFEAGGSERLADTPALIARIYRGRNYAHRIVVSAEKSYDLQQRPLTYHWVVLRGDAARIRIKPVGKGDGVVEIVVPWHNRRPIADGSPMDSNRVDIGVFVHNGEYYSAPGFVTFLFLDHEARTYDANGRLLEIGYGVGETEIQVPNWLAMLDLFKPQADSRGAQLLRNAFTKKEMTIILQAAEEYRPAHIAAETARKKRTQAEAVRRAADQRLKAAQQRQSDAQMAASSAGSESKTAGDSALSEWQAAEEAFRKAEADLAAARKVAEAASKAAEEVLNRKRDGLPRSVKESILAALRSTIPNSPSYAENAKLIAESARNDADKSAVAAARKRLVAWGLLQDSPDGGFSLRSLGGSAKPAAAPLTRFEKALLEQFQDQQLGRFLFPGAITCVYRSNFVDPRISAPKSWRDVYHYDSQGNCTGWTRYDGQQTTEFNAAGMMVLEKDAHGRCTKARAVRYEQETPKADSGRPPGPNYNPLRCVPANEIAHYEYGSEADWLGRIVKREKVQGDQ